MGKATFWIYWFMETDRSDTQPVIGGLFRTRAEAESSCLADINESLGEILTSLEDAEAHGFACQVLERSLPGGSFQEPGSLTD